MSSDSQIAAPRRIPSILVTLGRSMGQWRMRIGLGLTALIVLVAVLGPLLSPVSPTAIHGPPFSAPFGGAPFGTDYLGRDILSRVLHGGRSVLWMPFAAAALGMLIGTPLGAIAGYGRKGLDSLIMWLMDIALAFPNFVLPVLFVSLLGPTPVLIVLLVAMSHVPRVARLSRATTLQIASKEYIEACEILGMPRWRILLREILPNITTPLMVEFGIRLTWSVTLIAGMNFLGLGIQPPAADWGLMLNENRSGFIVQAWSVIPPILCIAVFAVGINLITEGFARTVAGVDARSQNR